MVNWLESINCREVIVSESRIPLEKYVSEELQRDLPFELISNSLTNLFSHGKYIQLYREALNHPKRRLFHPRVGVRRLRGLLSPSGRRPAPERHPGRLHGSHVVSPEQSSVYLITCHACAGSTDRTVLVMVE